MDKDDEKEVVKRIPRKYRRRQQKMNATKPTTEQKEQTSNKPINLVIFTF
jgi:hypothetical protein